jgi:hypothetical protein
MTPLVFDLDFTFGNPVYGHDNAYDFNTLVHATSPIQHHWSNAGCATNLLRNLLKNDSFKSQFITSFKHLMSHNFSYGHVNQRIDSFKALYEPAMQQHIDRWGHPSSLDAWNNEIEQMRLYALHRPCVLKNQFSDYFDEEIEIPCDQLPKMKCTQLWAAFPNPSNSGFIHFYRKNKKETSGTYTLFDAQGKMRKSGNLELNFQNKFQLMLSTEGLSSGVYLMQFILEGKIDTIRVVIL